MRQPLARQPTALVLHRLIAALPDSALRPLLVSLILDGAAPTAAIPAPTAPRAMKKRPRGWPKGKLRGKRKAGTTRVANGPASPTASAPLSHNKKTDLPADAMAAAGQKRTAQVARRRAKEAAQRAARRAAKNGNGTGGQDRQTSGQRGPRFDDAEKLWHHAEALAPGKLWRAIVREFGINEALARDHFKSRTVPPGIAPAAVERFAEVSQN